MHDQCPAPLVLPHINLKDVPSVLLDIDRLLESDFWLSTNGEETRAGMCLWFKSFKQLPAGSLPDDDTSLSRLCQVSADHWASVRAKALHGWVKCDDGRLYHPVVSEKVLLMHMYRLVQRLRGAKGMEVRYNIERDSGNDSVLLMHEVHACLDLLEALSASEAKKFREKYARTLSSSSLQTSGRRPAQRQAPQRDLLGDSGVSTAGAGGANLLEQSAKASGAKKRRSPKSDGTTYTSAFVEFWNLYPKKEGKQEAAASWSRNQLDGELQSILSDVRKKKLSASWLKDQGQYVPKPSTYLTQRRWDNDIDPSKIVDRPKAAVGEAISLPLSGASDTEPWWAQAGFTSAIEAENDGCHEGKQQQFMNGVRIKDVYGNPRPKGEIFDDLVKRMSRWMMNFTNEAFFPERDHALETMRSMPRIDFWSMLQGKMQESHRNSLRELLMALPEDSATGKALRT